MVYGVAMCMKGISLFGQKRPPVADAEMVAKNKLVVNKLHIE